MNEEVKDETSLISADRSSPGSEDQRAKARGVVTYHDACHLAHAQKVTSAPREVLANINNLELILLPESDMCCGAAGTYNLTQPEMATRLADRKLDNILSTGCKVCVSGNVGCTLHLSARARERGLDIAFVHPAELLHAAKE